jgi:O-antigen ligase
LLTLAMLVMIQKQGQPAEMIMIGQNLYGDKLAEDLTTFSGRKEVWSAAGPLVSHCLILGYGLDGSRDVLINNTTWGAGNAHNSFLDLILAAGFPAMLVFFAGWATAVNRAWQSRTFARVGVLGTYTYIAAFGIFSPNLTYLQGLASFLILTMDAMVFAEISQREASARRYFPTIEHYMPRQVADSWKRMPRRSL